MTDAKKANTSIASDNKSMARRPGKHSKTPPANWVDPNGKACPVCGFGKCFCQAEAAMEAK